ncbi:helix-turn-helix transcriptional regulator [Cohnella silvisoli]|uniref:AraC family transcriptional regulator n=1 Tax=Cohnella silvisoli TaxID=2873699 RepID=A0ABV1KR50_9BACL|nr:AraC family transcriptional regulator [Cohnella silvisoli]MCD9021735.1 AraC family transcriptional regulator [Cohnella silvisoli]
MSEPVHMKSELIDKLSMMIPIIHHVGWEVRDHKWACPTQASKHEPCLEYDETQRSYFRAIPYHWMMMVIEGQVEVILKDGKYKVEKDMLVNLPPHCLHRLRVDKMAKYVWVHYNVNISDVREEAHGYADFEREQERLTGAANYRRAQVDLPVLNVVQNPQMIRKVFVAVTEEFMLEEPGYLLASRANMQLLLTLLYRNEYQEKENRHSIGISDPYIAQTVEHIHQFFAHKLTVPQLAKSINLSPNYFTSRFGELTGFSPVEYIQRLRINHAKKLMRATNYTLTEIADLLGFDSISHFSRTFHKFEGISPKAYRITIPRY